MININIWDDYSEDGDVPEGEVQETYAYIESNGLSLEQEKSCLEQLSRYIFEQKILPKSVEITVSFYDAAIKYPRLLQTAPELCALRRWELRFRHLSHELREKLVEKIEDNFSFAGVPAKIYSGS